LYPKLKKRKEKKKKSHINKLKKKEVKKDTILGTEHKKSLNPKNPSQKKRKS
jgi:hypothetical protein